MSHQCQASERIRLNESTPTSSTTSSRVEITIDKRPAVQVLVGTLEESSCSVEDHLKVRRTLVGARP